MFDSQHKIVSFKIKKSSEKVFPIDIERAAVLTTTLYTRKKTFIFEVVLYRIRSAIMSYDRTCLLNFQILFFRAILERNEIASLDLTSYKTGLISFILMTCFSGITAIYKKCQCLR